MRIVAEVNIQDFPVENERAGGILCYRSDSFDTWEAGDGSDNRGLFFGSIFRNGEGSESFMTFYDQLVVTGEKFEPLEDGTERDWKFNTWKFADRTQCGKRVIPWGLMWVELRPEKMNIIRYTLEIREQDLSEIASLVSDWNYGAVGSQLKCHYSPHMSNKKLQESFLDGTIDSKYA